MRLFARQSVAAQVTPADWFRYTKDGLAFFDNYFGIPYQFEKYDQLLVPDFLYGAMENAGAITFAERGFLHKAAMTAAQRQSLAGVIMHEMAHQWFGDLVTMKWWNGLWLNESFASFMGTLATAEATEFKDAWQHFYSSGKQAAYVQDQKATTHPIEVPVPSTANAFDNIDAITYSKGASTLIQLRHLLGADVFRKGVHNYLVKYSYQNAKLEDFIGSLGEAAGRDLTGWTAVAVPAGREHDRGDSAAPRQDQRPSRCSRARRARRCRRCANSACKWPPSSSTATNSRAENVPVTYRARDPRAGPGGQRLPGHGLSELPGLGFCQGAARQAFLRDRRASLAGVDDPLLRTMLWQSLWDGVRDGKLPLNEFIETALANAPAEKDYTLLGDVLGKVRRVQVLPRRDGAVAWRARRPRGSSKRWRGTARGEQGRRQLPAPLVRHYLDLASSRPR